MSKRPRKFPKWMMGKRAAVGDAISNIVSTKSDENKANNFEETSEGSKRRLRSNYEFPKAEQEPKFNIDDLPMVDYSGKIHYFSDFYGIAEICDNLIKKVESAKGDDEADMVGVAFDSKFFFSFPTRPEY
jgi:hypothetical protein